MNELRNKILIGLVEAGISVRKREGVDVPVFEALITMRKGTAETVVYTFKIPMSRDELDDLYFVKFTDKVCTPTASAFRSKYVSITGTVLSICEATISQYEKERDVKPVTRPAADSNDKKAKANPYTHKYLGDVPRPIYGRINPSAQFGTDCFNDCVYGYACDVCPKLIPELNTY